jgi:hypothetical protein
MHYTKLLVVAGLLLSMAACKKEDETKLTLQDKLTGKVWKSTAFSNTGVPYTKWCDLNSLFEYTETGTVYVTQGDNQGACSGAAIGEIYTYKYVTSADDKYLIYVTPWPGAADTFEIVSISTEVLKTKRYVNGGGEVWEDTYTAQ